MRMKRRSVRKVSRKQTSLHTRTRPSHVVSKRRQTRSVPTAHTLKDRTHISEEELQTRIQRVYSFGYVESVKICTPLSRDSTRFHIQLDIPPKHLPTTPTLPVHDVIHQWFQAEADAWIHCIPTIWIKGVYMNYNYVSMYAEHRTSVFHYNEFILNHLVERYPPVNHQNQMIRHRSVLPRFNPIRHRNVMMLFYLRRRTLVDMDGLFNTELVKHPIPKIKSTFGHISDISKIHLCKFASNERYQLQTIVKRKYRLYLMMDAYSKTTHDTLHSWLCNASHKTLKHIIYGYQVLETKGALLLYLDHVSTPFVHHLIVWVTTMFKHVKLFTNELFPVHMLGVCLWCDGFIGYRAHQFEQLIKLDQHLDELSTRQFPSSIDSLIVVEGGTSRNKLYTEVKKVHQQCMRRINTLMSVWTHPKYDEYTFQIRALQNKVAKDFHTKCSMSDITIPKWAPYKGSRPVKYMYLIDNHPASSALFTSLRHYCDTKASTDTRLVFHGKDHVYILASHRLVDASGYPANGTVLYISLDPITRFLLTFQDVLKASDASHGIDSLLYKMSVVFKQHGIRRPYDILRLSLPVRRMLFDTKLFCNQQAFCADTFHQVLNPTLSIYKYKHIETLCKLLETHLHIPSIECPLPNLSVKTSILDIETRSMLETQYESDYTFFQYKKIAKELSQIPTMHVMSTINQSQHFWHMMLGEFLPLVYLIRTSMPKKIVLYKMQIDSPFNVFYTELVEHIPQLDIEIHGDMEKIDARYSLLTPWDHVTFEELQNSGDDTRLRHTMDYLKTLVPPSNRKQSEFVIEQRMHDTRLDAYYEQHYADKTGKAQSFMQTHGKSRRGVHNMTNMIQTIQTKYPNATVVSSTSQTPLFDQIRAHMYANTFVFEHGAAMFYILCMQPKATLIEMIPENKSKNRRNKAVQATKWLAALGEHHLQRIIVPSSHSHANISLIMKTLQRTR